MAKDKRMLSEKELARWREEYKNAGRPCLCAELLDHIDAQAKRITDLKKQLARKQWTMKAVTYVETALHFLGIPKPEDFGSRVEALVEHWKQRALQAEQSLATLRYQLAALENAPAALDVVKRLRETVPALNKDPSPDPTS